MDIFSDIMFYVWVSCIVKGVRCKRGVKEV